MMKIVIHKLKWQSLTLEGWCIRPNQINFSRGYCSLCNGMSVDSYHRSSFSPYRYYGNGAIKWKHVTCKNCLKMRKFGRKQ
jgi:hypothetical protein